MKKWFISLADNRSLFYLVIFLIMIISAVLLYVAAHMGSILLMSALLGAIILANILVTIV